MDAILAIALLAGCCIASFVLGLMVAFRLTNDAVTAMEAEAEYVAAQSDDDRIECLQKAADEAIERADRQEDLARMYEDALSEIARIAEKRHNVPESLDQPC